MTCPVVGCHFDRCNPHNFLISIEIVLLAISLDAVKIWSQSYEYLSNIFNKTVIFNPVCISITITKSIYSFIDFKIFGQRLNWPINWRIRVFTIYGMLNNAEAGWSGLQMLREGLCRYKGMRPLSLWSRFSRKCRRSSLVLCARSKDNGRRLELQIGDSPRHGFVLHLVMYYELVRSWLGKRTKI